MQQNSQWTETVSMSRVLNSSKDEEKC